jgi:crotonobetainyl-CoA:carnitine CoA-transferase CaiB-like acyl-CoA transferase
MGGFCDPTVGLHAVTAIELALRHREQTGMGTEVEVPQCETLDSLFAPEHIAVQHGAPVPARRGNQHEWMAPHNSYRVADDERWIAIAIASDAEFAALTEVLGAPELAGHSRFATVVARKENETALDIAIAAAVKDKQLVPLERALQAAGVKASRVTEPSALDKDDGLQHRRFFQTLTREVTGTHPFKTWPFRFTSIDTSHKRPPPLLGQHNAEVLTSLLGLSQKELDSLKKEQIIGDSPLGFAG